MAQLSNTISVEISLRYALMANDVFRDRFKYIGHQSYTNVYEFQSNEDAQDFIDVLVCDHNMLDEAIMS
jgi:hypothetical protein